MGLHPWTKDALVCKRVHDCTELLVISLLYILGCGTSYCSLWPLCHISSSKCCTFFNVFLDALNNMCEKFISMPQNVTKLWQIARSCKHVGLPWCCGSMDVVHVRWSQCLSGDLNRAKGKESYPSLAFECVTDYNWRIMGVYVLITMCAQLPNAFGDSQYAIFLVPTRMHFGILMHSVIPIWKILHNGLVLLISHTRTITKRIRLVTEPVPKCIRGSPYAFGDSYNPQMHTGIVNVLIPKCIWGFTKSPNAFGDLVISWMQPGIDSNVDPWMHLEINVTPVCVWG